jgi:phage-related minor tail protein
MTSPFDTVSAAKRLRDAGVEERAAEAIVDLVQWAARMPDISDLATKSDLNELALATKSEFDKMTAQMATKSELKSEIHALRLELKGDIAALETRFSQKLRVQGWALMGGMATLITIYTALIKLLP